MGRLPGFDYKRPFFYMVTLKRVRVLQPPVLQGGASAPPMVARRRGQLQNGQLQNPPFCTISDGGEVVANAVTRAFEAAIREWAAFWRSVESVLPYVIMPDHLHLLIRLAAVEKAVSLAVVVGDLRKRLNRAYWGAVGMLPADAGNCKTGAADAAPCKTGEQGRGRGPVQNPPVLEPEWHDWIVKKRGQLAAFRKYILENPLRCARRRANRRYFTRARQITFRGKRYWAYGNEALLELPAIVAIKGHRRGVLPGGAGGMLPADAGNCKTAAALREAAARIGPGGAGLSTFLSPLEKEAGNTIIAAGGALIVLCMTGFGERWHPTERQERLCAAGRMLYLSPYAPQAAKLDKKEMYIRAHALADWALEHSHESLEAWP